MLPNHLQDHYLRFIRREQTQPLSDKELKELEVLHQETTQLHLQLDQILFSQRTLRRQINELAAAGNKTAKQLLADLA